MSPGVNAAQRFNLLGRNTVLRKQDERSPPPIQQLMRKRKKKSKLCLNLKARAHHRCSRLHQRPGDADESQPNWLVCEAGEAGCVPAVSSRRLSSFSFIILVTSPPRPWTGPPRVWPEKRKRPRTMDPGVIGRMDEENFIFFLCLFLLLFF